MIVILLYSRKINSMKSLDSFVQIQINENTFIKDPESSELGRRILEHSVILIHELGFEQFTFKKLGERIGSNESSIYRYFENKHKLLLYLASWYWGWLEYRLVLHTHGVDDPVRKLEKAIAVITSPMVQSTAFKHIDAQMLHTIMIEEYSKSYLTKKVDQRNKEGYFEVYKRLIKRLVEMILAVDPNYPFPNSLASLIYEGNMHQSFLNDHFPSLTDCENEVDRSSLFTQLLSNTLKPTEDEQ